MDATLEVNDRQVSERALLSAFSGLAVLCVLVAVLAASTFITSGDSAATLDVSASPSHDFGGTGAIPSTTFYLLEIEAQFEEIKGGLGTCGRSNRGHTASDLPARRTSRRWYPDEEAVANARILDQVRSSEGAPLSIEVIDLRAQRPE